MDAAIVALILGCVTVAGGVVGWVAPKIWKSGVVTEHISSQIEKLGLTLQNKIDGVMFETKQQTLQLNHMAEVQREMKVTAAQHGDKDDERFKEVLTEVKDARHKSANVAQAVSLVEREVVAISKESAARREKEMAAYYERVRERSRSPGPFKPPGRDG